MCTCVCVWNNQKIEKSTSSTSWSGLLHIGQLGSTNSSVVELSHWFMHPRWNVRLQQLVCITLVGLRGLGCAALRRKLFRHAGVGVLERARAPIPPLLLLEECVAGLPIPHVLPPNCFPSLHRGCAALSLRLGTRFVLSSSKHMGHISEEGLNKYKRKPIFLSKNLRMRIPLGWIPTWRATSRGSFKARFTVCSQNQHTMRVTSWHRSTKASLILYDASISSARVGASIQSQNMTERRSTSKMSCARTIRPREGALDMSQQRQSTPVDAMSSREARNIVCVCMFIAWFYMLKSSSLSKMSAERKHKKS